MDLPSPSSRLLSSLHGEPPPRCLASSSAADRSAPNCCSAVDKSQDLLSMALLVSSVSRPSLSNRASLPLLSMSLEFPCDPLDGINNFESGGARPSPILRSWYTSEIVGVSSRLRRRSCVAIIWSCMLLGPLFEVKPPPLGLLEEMTSGASSNDFDSGADMSLPPPQSEGK